MIKWSRHITFRIQREPGFRFNLIDAGLLFIMAAMSYLLHTVAGEGGLFLMPLYVGLSFFLFCNVFRIGNRLEPYWYIPFAIALVLLHHQPKVLWWVILLVLEPLKVALILYCIRRGGYHGAWASKMSTGSGG